MTWAKRDYYWEKPGFTIAITGRPGAYVHLLWDLRSNKRGDLVAVRRARTDAQAELDVAELKGLAR